MLVRLVAWFLIASLCAAQAPSAPQTQRHNLGNSMLPGTRESAGSVTPNGTNVPEGGSITVPQGSLVALKLISTIRSKSTHTGDPIRAVVAFPLAIGAHLAIPAGSYVEGVIDKVNAHSSGAVPATVQLRFSRLLFANGYSVPLVATNTQAAAPMNDPRRPKVELADARDGEPYLGEGFAGQNPTQPPPLPSMGPSPGVLAGIGIGSGVGILVLTLAINHRRVANTDYVLFDSGWQFQMALEEPLTLDAAQISAATAMEK
jgi:hypothetical protein